ncbi:MAG: dihydrofolate reductase, partial [SAR116 cluster bacterium]|nr:dihydrofolate reductase [SAR116 cluster bacterium]
ALALSRDWIAAIQGARPEIILFGGSEIYAAGMPLCNRSEATIVDISPNGGPNAALFPALDESEWNHEVLEEAVADGEVPGYRYERFTRKTPVTV